MTNHRCYCGALMFYKWSPVSSDLCLVEAITRSRVLCQCNPVGGSNQGLGRQDASSWATGNSLGTDKFGNRLGIVLRHDPPRFFSDHRTSRDCGIRRLPLAERSLGLRRAAPYAYQDARYRYLTGIAGACCSEESSNPAGSSNLPLRKFGMVVGKLSSRT